MREANAALVAFLATRRNAIQADLFTITLASGAVYTWTSYEAPLRVGPYIFSPLTGAGRGPLIDRTKWGVKNTIDVPEMEVRIYSNGADMPDGSNLKLSVHNGLLDYATVKLSRIFMPTPGDTSLGAVDLFIGNVSQIEIDALSVTMTVKGANVQLQQYMPRNQYMLSCIHSVYDQGCAPNPGQPGGGPSRAANTFSNTVGAGSTRTLINWGSGTPANYAHFALGYITFTSGTSAGITRTIPGGQATAAGVGLAYPLYVTPAEGDEFTVTYGCDRTRSGANGCPFFSNTQHYRGFRWTPPAEFGV
jgi:hypothetical protein